METNLQQFISQLKLKTTKQTNKELYNLMVENLNDPVLSKKYKDQLVTNNVRLVIQKVTEYIKSPKLMLFDDLVQEGIIGLTKSIDTYNPDLKFNFSTWASVHIKKHILRYMDASYMPKPHTQITENIDRIRRIQNKLMFKLHRPPVPEEVKRELDKTMKKKSKFNKKINKHRLSNSLSPLSEQIGVNKDGKFIGISLSIIRYIMDIINTNSIMHSINLEQGSRVSNDINGDEYSDCIDAQDHIIGNVLYKNMYEDIISLIADLPVRNAEIIDMVLGLSYNRPYSLEEIKTVLFNIYDNRSYKYTLPIISRLTKMCFNKLRAMENIDVNKGS